MTVAKWVYSFGEVAQLEAELDGSWEAVRSLLGGKGANLANMTRMGVPVPPGFTITTAACNAYLQANQQLPDGLWEQATAALETVETATEKRFGDPQKPLLVSSRSGAKFSMPGMMDTVLNLGLNDEVAQGMAQREDNAHFIYDCYRRLVQMFGSVVLGVPDEDFEDTLCNYKLNHARATDADLTAEDWQQVTRIFQSRVQQYARAPFPQDAHTQLRQSIEAVFKSWHGRRARDYRRAADIADDLGTAVTIQTMVFGNLDANSGTGVAFTRSPSSGERRLFGEYLPHAQGEDVVAGIRNPKPIEQLETEMPEAHGELADVCNKLERHYHEMQDVEFTIEQDKLWMLQTRDGKRTARAAVCIAVDMVGEGLITREQALLRVTPEQVNTLLHPQFEPEAVEEARSQGRLYATGVNASPGAAVGQVYFDADTVERVVKETGAAVILVRPFTKPDDVHGMLAAKGILTREGGATSHAAVVARQFGVPCVAAAASIRINLEQRSMRAEDVVVNEGDWISIDGASGDVFLGRIATREAVLEEQSELLTLLEWADEVCAATGMRAGPDGWPSRGLQVWANADYPADAQRARQYGATGIGLCRTEHMFFQENRLPVMQRMILAQTPDERQAALDELLPMQREDFEGIFEAMRGCPVIVRLLDPPLHEFLPDEYEVWKQVVSKRVTSLARYLLGQETPDDVAQLERLLARVQELHENNPMLGLRAVRLSIMLPQIVEMQVRAIIEAAANVELTGTHVQPEIMIPLVGHLNELNTIQPRLKRVARAVMDEKGVELAYKFGTMIEIPRAAITGAEIAEAAEFFSFGTNDLTQMTYGFSRDDAERNFLLKYVEDGILPSNPFQTIDRDGVGQLMRMCVESGRHTRPDLEVGICGEHGGDADSIDFCHLIGMDYVSCSPFRIPVARLAAAHAALRHKPAN